LTAPRDGTPEPVVSADQLAEVVERFAAGTGPVAVDAERASGYRYSQRAYLVQLRRAGAGTAIIDPLPLGDLRPLASALADEEWVLHAASQDLPCLAELGMEPRRLFDTELAARLAGFERVGLAAIVEQLLGYQLDKNHSAADWSTRPLPETWLAYAALDVELLLELREALAAELERQGKTEWAAQEFAAIIEAAAQPPRPRPDPWRRTSGIHKIRGARALARVRALWYARDEVAARRDLAPRRVLPDAALITAAEADPATERELIALPGFSGRTARQLAPTWLAALARARELPEEELPRTPVTAGPPPAHRWAERDPVAAERLRRCRETVAHLSATHRVPPENLVPPDHLRRLAWEPPPRADRESVAEALRRMGSRPWQIDLAAAALAEALATTPA
jgi:ribonuclease D